MEWSVVVVVVETATAHFWQSAEYLVTATQNDISTSKSAPCPSVFSAFDFETCFAPQWRALFWHLNFEKWSGAGVFCTVWLGNVIRATMACTFSTSQLPKVVREWCVLYILTSKCALCHNEVQFFISHLPRWLRTCRFSEPQIIGKTQWIATFLPFRAPASSFFSLSLSLFLFPDLLSSSLLFSHSSHLCFSSVHIVESLTKLPSNIIYIYIVFFPTCQVRVVRFYVSCLLLPRPPPLLLSSSSSSSSLSSLSSLSSSSSSSNCDPRSTVFSAGPQPRPSTPSVPCRTSTTTSHAQCSLPDLNHDQPRPVFPAGPHLRVSMPSVPCRTSCRKIWDKENARRYAR